MSERFRAPMWLWSLLFIGAIISAWIAIERHRVEASARAVHVAVPIEDIRILASGSGVSIESAFRALRDAGMTAVIVGEENFDQLLANGDMVAVVSQTGVRQYVFSNRELFERVRIALLMRFPQSVEQNENGIALYYRNAAADSTIRDAMTETESFVFPAPVFDLKNVGVGFNREACASVLKEGLTLIGRVMNPPAATESSVQWVVEEVAAVGASGVIFTGDQVLGWEEAIPSVAESLEGHDIWYGSVEFGKQAGDRQLKSRLIETHLRVHSVQAAEMPQNAVRSILDRYVRAARERNIRVLLVRPPRPADENPFASFVQFVEKLRAELIKEGSGSKTPKPIAAPDIPNAVRSVPAFLALLIAGWMWSRLTKGGVLRLVGLLPLLAIALLLGIGIATGRFLEPSLKLSALVAAIVFPVFAMTSIFTSNDRGSTIRWIAAFFVVCGISILGGLYVAAMLTSLQYMVQVDQFFGVKLAHFMPPILVGGYLLLESFGWKQTAGANVRWLDVGLFTIIAGALGFTVLRSGNEAPSAVSGFELQFRELLERLLPQRPRTKEALVGHPALVVALGMAATGRKSYLPLACLVAAIGQVSIVNTFCHLHTPIEVSVVRVLTGMVCGGIVGGAVWIAVHKLWRGTTSQS